MFANTTSPITPPQFFQPNTVGWPSLFFGLLPFAINSMTQPAGMVCGANADVGFLLRSSPIICILDAFLVLWDLFSIYRVQGSFSRAQDEMIQRRFRSEIYRGFKKAKELDILRSSEQVFRVVAFLLSASQMIKLFGYSGLVWAKIIAAAYLMSFLIIEMLVVWPVANKKAIKDAKQNISAERTSIALAVIFLLPFAAMACRDIVGWSDHTLLQWVGIVIGSLGFISAVPAMGYSYWHREPGTRSEIATSAVILVLVLGTPIGFYFTGRIIPESMPGIWVKVLCGVVAFVWGGIALLYGTKTTESVRRPKKEKQRKTVEQVGAWYFFLLHLVTSLLYYMFSYDPSGTIRPAWTEWLD
ncbi:hypothetical protein CC77DRAFT_1023058 [Alternaria alternata]|jgi:hypothetical protein|uniref:Uncharacterized protein n=2 Tax=Alternaria alternata complex TaxID=187734 RepID=A0A177DEG2_ALTAL|nr:hypothetical protein CC77DRAFT_1023058 [Alternaria alternata]OAG17542.1 hypothetical protein CC77DRAFT_1023058 [Alternaria alternata]RYN48297.1 hypothetical protein AA0114_g7208 [Alternaria tenuissima]